MEQMLRAALALALGCTGAQAACPAVGAEPPPIEAVAAANPDPGWQKRVGELDGAMARADLGRIRMLFLGDSLTEAWVPVVFDHFYGHRAPLNLGVRGDTTQGLLSRLPRLPLGASLRPQLVVLLIGTNDLWPGVNPANVAIGIGTVVHEIRRRAPQSHILLVGLLPRGAEPDDPLRRVRLAVNALLAGCADGAVTFADPGAMLLDGEGRLSKDYAFDTLHLTWLGYAVLGAGLEPYIRQAFGG